MKCNKREGEEKGVRGCEKEIVEWEQKEVEEKKSKEIETGMEIKNREQEKGRCIELQMVG